MLTERERGGMERVRQQRPAVANGHNYNGDSETREGGDAGKMWSWIEVRKRFYRLKCAISNSDC